VIKEMKRFILPLGAVLIVLLMVSTVTAVPQVNSNPLMIKINEIEENKKIITEKLTDIKVDVETGGIIDILRQIIEWLIDLVQRIIDLILDIFGLVDLIEYLIGLIVSLFELIMTLINFIIDIFNPNTLRF
jgi:hypothetical protein